MIITGIGDASRHEVSLQFLRIIVIKSSLTPVKASSFISYELSEGVTVMSTSQPLILYLLSKMRYLVTGGIILRASTNDDSG